MNRKLVIALLSLMLIFGGLLVSVLTLHFEKKGPWRIGLTNWPGFDYLYLADEKKLFEKHGLSIQLVPVNSMTDMRMAFERGQLDGYTGTNQDVTESILTAGTAGRVVLVTDFSHGGDKLLADPSITTITDLKGKQVGLEVTSPLAKYFLHRALSFGGLRIEDIRVLPYSQTLLVEQMKNRMVDAVVTYVPYATEMQQARPLNVLFDSTRISGEIIDLLVVSPSVLEADPEFGRKLQAVWQEALDYAALHPEEAVGMFAARYSLTMSEYRELMMMAKMMDVHGMQALAREGKIHRAFLKTGEVLGNGIAESVVSQTISIWRDEEGGQ